jgi:hypothetical protein
MIVDEDVLTTLVVYSLNVNINVNVDVNVNGNGNGNVDADRIERIKSNRIKRE